MKLQITNWDELPLMLNTKEVASLIGYGPQTIRELCHSKEIPHARFGRSFVFPRDRIRAWIESVANNNMKRM